MIDKNYGFEYKRRIFVKLLIILIGIVNVEKLEQQLKQKCLYNSLALDSLKKRRNNEAHTYIHGTDENNRCTFIDQEIFS